MELKIIKEKENSLFARKEVQLSLEATVPPKKDEAATLIAQQFSTQPENISVKGVYGKFGSKEFTINANIYSSKEEKEKTELKRKKGEEPKETPVEMPVQEQAETKVEEKKQEAQEKELANPDKEPATETKAEKTE